MKTQAESRTFETAGDRLAKIDRVAESLRAVLKAHGLERADRVAVLDAAMAKEEADG